ncbi:MAG: hypothetical protein MZV49_21615 [Rhodopseudomonas palustris]|nr:hypothetical protein [Rhodopseudomonas palustris]
MTRSPSSRTAQSCSYRPTARFAELPPKSPGHIRAVETEQSNSTALVDSDYVVKIYRRLDNGLNPEIEIGRFLTDVAGFANTPALLGSIEYHDGSSASAVAVVHAFVQNQGDGWSADLGLSRPLSRRAAAAERHRSAGGKRAADAVSAADGTGRPAGRRAAPGAAPATRKSPISRRSRSARRRLTPGSTRSPRPPIG